MQLPLASSNPITENDVEKNTSGCVWCETISLSDKTVFCPAVIGKNFRSRTDQFSIIKIKYIQNVQMH